MPAKTPNSVGAAAAHFRMDFQTGRVTGTIDIRYLQRCAQANADLRQQLGVFFGILNEDGHLFPKPRLPQIRKNILVYLVTGTRNSTWLEPTIFRGTAEGCWRMEHGTGRRVTYTPGPGVMLSPEGIDLFTSQPHPDWAALSKTIAGTHFGAIQAQVTATGTTN